MSNLAAPGGQPGAIAAQNPQGFAGLTTEQWNILKSSICKGFTDDEAKVFALRCQAIGLSPFAGQITAFRQGGGVIPIVTIDGYRAIAASLDPDYVVEREYLVDGQWVNFLPDGVAAQARALVYRGGDTAKRPIVFPVSRKEFGGSGRPWQTMPNHMLGKVAESHALRVAYPQRLAGTYTTDEMEAVNIDITAQGDSGRVVVEPQSEVRLPAPSQESETVTVISDTELGLLLTRMAEVLTPVGEEAFIATVCDGLRIAQLSEVPAAKFRGLMATLSVLDKVQNWNKGLDASGKRQLVSEKRMEELTPRLPEDTAEASTVAAEVIDAEIALNPQEAAPVVKRKAGKPRHAESAETAGLELPELV